VAEIAVFGTVAVDVVLRVPRLPRQGDHLAAETLGWRLGGSSANLACGLAAAGHTVELIGPVGTDGMADALVAELDGRGVGTHRLRRIPGPSPTALILLQPDGERTIIGLGPAAETSPTDDPPDLGGVDCVYVEGYGRFSTAIAERAVDALVVASPPAGVHDLWPADVVVGSESQYPDAMLRSPFEAVRRVTGSRLRWVVVTRGRAGADAYGPEGSIHVGARPAKQVDATGAGDAFAAGLISGLLAQVGIVGAMELGAVPGAAAVEVLQSVPPEWFPGESR